MFAVPVYKMLDESLMPPSVIVSGLADMMSLLHVVKLRPPQLLQTMMSHRGAAQRPASLLQIANRTDIFLVDLITTASTDESAAALNEAIGQLFQSKSTIKLGYGRSKIPLSTRESARGH